MWVINTNSGTLLYGQPHYTDSFICPDKKLLYFSLKLTRFIRTRGNTDNGHFSVSRVTNSHSQARFMDTGYLHTV